MAIYNIGIWFYMLAVRLASLFNRKARLMVRGRRGIMERLCRTVGERKLPNETPTNETPTNEAYADGHRVMTSVTNPVANPVTNPVIWIHCSSLGEFEQGRPVIEAIKSEHPECRIVLTFFSPSGYEIRKNYNGADWVFYLPYDTPRRARMFVSIVKPAAAIFIKYEYWLNYFRALRRGGVRTFLVSAIFRPDSIFFKRHGGIFRQALKGCERLFVQDDSSAELLAGIGITNVTVSGDTRFDRVAQVAESAPEIEIVRRFADGSKVLVAGSTWPRDEEIILPLIRNYPDLKFIIAPHELDDARIERFVAACAGCGGDAAAVRYTHAVESGEPVEHAKVLIIDTIGILSAVYRYGAYGYIGGGFGAGIHNTLEAAAFGLPIAFGPNYQKFREASELIELGAAHSISSAQELDAWLGGLEGSPSLYAAARAKALSYVSGNRGATETFLATLFPL